MGDGISTKFESRACIASDLENYGGGKATKTAETLAQLCYDIIMKNGKAAYKAVQNQVVTKALEEVIEANIYLSGVGAEGTGDAGAHGLHDALTLIPECRKYMHGELVSFGTLVQLVLENESEEQIKETLDKIAQAALEASFPNLPFEVTKESIHAAIVIADAVGEEFKKSIKQ